MTNSEKPHHIRIMGIGIRTFTLTNPVIQEYVYLSIQKIKSDIRGFLKLKHEES